MVEKIMEILRTSEGVAVYTGTQNKEKYLNEVKIIAVIYVKAFDMFFSIASQKHKMLWKVKSLGKIQNIKIFLYMFLHNFFIYFFVAYYLTQVIFMEVYSLVIITENQWITTFSLWCLAFSIQ